VGRLNPAGTGLEYTPKRQLHAELEEAAARVQQEYAEIQGRRARTWELNGQEGEGRGNGRPVRLNVCFGKSRGPAHAGPLLIASSGSILHPAKGPKRESGAFLRA